MEHNENDTEREREREKERETFQIDFRRHLKSLLLIRSSAKSEQW